MHRHISLLGLLYLGLGALGLLGAVIAFIAIVVGGALADDPRTFATLSIIGVVFLGILAVLSIPSIVAGLGLMARKSWSRPLTLVLAVLHLFSFPFGTALGIYSLWVLLKEESAALLGARA